ncbi:MAG: hypothetical protein JWP59_3585 [Massilia sp.]|nr:hypothetical protein [Massilia sp.]
MTDRYGNWVRYTYDPANPRNLISITASDGRALTLSYARADMPNTVTSVTDGTRTWQYSYVDNRLDTAVLPDGTNWEFSNIHLLQQAAPYPPADSINCDSNLNVAAQTISASMIHPSGATGTFYLTTTEHGRSDVPRGCRQSGGGNTYAGNPRYIATRSLTNKTITGPGMPALTWLYGYGPSNASWAPCTANCVKSKIVQVTDPSGSVTRYTFGNQYRVSEGRLEQVDIGWNGSAATSTTVSRYRAAGRGRTPLCTATAARHCPMRRRSAARCRLTKR